MEDANIIQIPTSNNSVVQLQVSELGSHEPSEIIDILRAELCPLSLWQRFAIEYYRQGHHSAFETMLKNAPEQGMYPEFDLQYGDCKQERVDILNRLAAFYTDQARAERDKRRKDELYVKATQHFNHADRIDYMTPSTWVGKGILSLSRGEDMRALDHFTTALEGGVEGPAAVPANLGKACVFFKTGKVQEALHIYAGVLRQNPQCPETVRLGMGLCYYKLKQVHKARLCFERVIKLNPRSIEGYIALAVLTLNQPEIPDRVLQAMRLFKEAYNIDNTNAMVLNNLANHFFYKQDYEKAMGFALNAYHFTTVDPIRAESCYHIARVYHVRKDYSEAFKHYFQAVRLDPSYVLPRFGLGQMYVHRGEVEKAIQCFEAVLKEHPDNFEALKFLGSLYAQTSRTDLAYQYVKRVTDLYADDLDSWIELAQLSEARDTRLALTAWEHALRLQTARGDKIQYQLWNNIGALRHIHGDLEGAREAYQKALAVTGHTEDEIHGDNVTIVYNLALLDEKCGNRRHAEHLHKVILKEHPNYVDCYLRLGVMARDQSQLYDASVWFKEALGITPDHKEAWTLLGNLHLVQEAWSLAQKKFERVLKSNGKDDAFCLLSIGNIFFQTARGEKEKKFLERALHFYTRVLQRDPTNLYAAHGIGVVLAQQGHLAEAKTVFTQVREARSDYPDVLINLAHLYMAQKNWASAIQMYKKCLERFYHNHEPELLLYIAKAHFEAEQYYEAKQTLLKILHLTPHNYAVRYNIAVVQQQHALALLTQTREAREKRAVRTIESLMTQLQLAQSIFEALAETSLPNLRSLAGPARKQSDYCLELLQTALEHLQYAREMEQRLDEEAERHAAHQYELEQRALAEREAQEQSLLADKQRRAELAEERARHLEELQRTWAVEEAASERRTRGAGRGRRAASTAPEDDIEDYTPEPSPPPPLSPLPKDEPDADTAGTDTEQDSAQPSRHRRLRRRVSRGEGEMMHEDGDDLLMEDTPAKEERPPTPVLGAGLGDSDDEGLYDGNDD